MKITLPVVSVSLKSFNITLPKLAMPSCFTRTTKARTVKATVVTPTTESMYKEFMSTPSAQARVKELKSMLSR